MRRQILALLSVGAFAIAVGCEDGGAPKAARSSTTTTEASTRKTREAPTLRVVQAVFTDRGADCHEGGILKGRRDDVLSEISRRTDFLEAGTDPATMETTRRYEMLYRAVLALRQGAVVTMTSCAGTGAAGPLRGDLWTYSAGGEPRVFLVQVGASNSTNTTIEDTGAKLAFGTFGD